jgi:hypothetical protein
MMTNYNDRDMHGITSDDYDTLLVHLGEQLAGAMRRDGYSNLDADEANKYAVDALANTWQADLTGRGWLAAAGRRLDVDTSACVGV